ncbi:hypothetical protein PCL1606_27570 [Pseudomonas chlororaphis]|uniref:Uncharacterized protein n=1 Tax=Pseudomonas chlororaphis TaxID=587753 RepID=A0A0D5XYQ1_9PSED|nr:hypothetical protein PCL1606_27570 [Pseudomonas chlororaphis]
MSPPKNPIIAAHLGLSPTPKPDNRGAPRFFPQPKTCSRCRAPARLRSPAKQAQAQATYSP